MSVSFSYIVRGKSPTFNYGTSNDVVILDTVFPGRSISTDDISKLRAMHAATQREDSLWNEIANKLEVLQGSNYEKKIVIEIETQY